MLTLLIFSHMATRNEDQEACKIYFLFQLVESPEVSFRTLIKDPLYNIFTYVQKNAHNAKYRLQIYWIYCMFHSVAVHCNITGNIYF